MICPICNGRRYQLVQNYDGLHDIICPKCNGIGIIDDDGKPILTNEEYLKSLGTEQLAEWIAKIVDCDSCPVKRKFCDDNPCKIRFVEWLKQPHNSPK